MRTITTFAVALVCITAASAVESLACGGYGVPSYFNRALHHDPLVSQPAIHEMRVNRAQSLVRAARSSRMWRLQSASLAKQIKHFEAYDQSKLDLAASPNLIVSCMRMRIAELEDSASRLDLIVVALQNEPVRGTLIAATE